MKRDLAKGVNPKMRGHKIKKRKLARGVKAKRRETNIGRKTRTGCTAKQFLCTCHKFAKENNSPNDI